MDRVCSVEGCDKKHDARWYCTRHYNMWYNRGTTESVRTPKGDPHKLLLDCLVYEGNECLMWPYGDNGKGYGRIKIDGVKESVHVIVCTIKHGAIPTSKHEVAHSCGNGLCLNHKHLRWSTRSENQMDKVEHGTSSRGERCARAKLTEYEVLKIMKDYRSQYKIAKDYGVTRSAIKSIKSGNSWYWLTGVERHND